MTLWLIRAGKHGEFEEVFLEQNKVCLMWKRLGENLAGLSRDEVKERLRSAYPESSAGKLRNHAAQVYAFAIRIAAGDWFVMPSKLSATIHVGEITSGYHFKASAGEYRHQLECSWIAKDLPRSLFDQDLLYSFGAFLTICKITRNDAEKRVRAMAQNEWKASIGSTLTPLSQEEEEEEEGTEADSTVDLEQVAEGQIARLIDARLKGHGLARLVEALLQAQGYTTHRSPEGPDKGVDLLAGSGPLGFDAPRICVQVKSGDSPLDRPTLDQLIGTMQNVRAEHGIFVSWGGFRSTVRREMATQFFRVRLWDQGDVIRETLEHYHLFDDELRAELPLKKIWTVAVTDESDD